MTPKEKAQELYNKCNPHCLIKNFYGDDVEIKSTKLCALIAVDEILKVLYSLKFGNALSEELDYWDEVKQEIKNLKKSIT